MAVQSIGLMQRLSSDTFRGPSESIWGDCPVDLIAESSKWGYHWWEDFAQWGKSTAIASNLGRYNSEGGNYVTWEDTSSTLLPLTGYERGAIRASVVGTTHLAVNMELGDGITAATGPFTYTDGSGPKLWFEASLQLGAITDNKQNYFIGLAQSATSIVCAAATSTTTVFDTSNNVGQIDKIGFQLLASATSGTGAILRGVYGKVSTAEVAVGTVATLVAATTVKVGFVIDPYTIFTNSSLARKKIRWFLNGQEVQSTTTTASADGFPTGRQLTPTFSHQCAASTAITSTVDWMRCAQLAAA